MALHGGASSGSSVTGYEAGPITVPTVASLTWNNQGTSTATDGTGALILKPQVDNTVHLLEQVAPSAPYSVYCRVRFNMYSATSGNTMNCSAGLVLRDSSGGKIYTLGTRYDRGASVMEHSISAQHWTNATTFGASVSQLYNTTTAYTWLRIDVTSTQITSYVSYDGKNWQQFSTESIASYMSAVNRIGIFSLGTVDSTTVVSEFSYFSTTTPA